MQRKWSDCAILVTAILFLLQPVEWYHYIVGLFDPSHTLPDWGVGAMYKEVAEYTKEGNLWEFLGKNMTFGQKASLYWAFGAGRFWQTAGLFLMGLYIGRKQLFVTSEKHTRFWVKALIISAISFAPLFQLKELIMASDRLPERLLICGRSLLLHLCWLPLLCCFINGTDSRILYQIFVIMVR